MGYREVESGGTMLYVGLRPNRGIEENEESSARERGRGGRKRRERRPRGRIAGYGVSAF